MALGNIVFVLAAVLVAESAAADGDYEMKLVGQQGTLLRPKKYDDPVQLDVFIDLNCKDSKESWKTMKQLSDHFGRRLEVKVHQYPLPYHTYAFILAQGFYLVQDRAPENVWKYVDVVFENLNAFNNKNTTDKSTSTVIRHLANIQRDQTGIESLQFEIDIHEYRRKAIYEWKFGASRGVSGTPWFFLNGVNLNLDPNNPWSLQTWKQKLQPLVEAVNLDPAPTPCPRPAVQSYDVRADNNGTNQKTACFALFYSVFFSLFKFIFM